MFVRARSAIKVLRIGSADVFNIVNYVPATVSAPDEINHFTYLYNIVTSRPCAQVRYCSRRNLTDGARRRV